MQVAAIMKTEVRTASRENTFAEVAEILHDNRISSVVVMDGEQPAGIVTERDLVNVVAEGLDPREVRCRDRMTRELDTVEPRADVAEAAEHMARLQIRHLPVVDEGKLVGIVSIRDLITWAVGELTGGHELPDIERSHTTLSAAAEIHRTT